MMLPSGNGSSKRRYTAIARAALREDLAGRDLTSRACIDRAVVAVGSVVAKSRLVLAGTGIATAVFRERDARTRVVWLVREGAWVERSTKVANVVGRARALLSAERVALNFLMHLSGVATLTRRIVEACEGTGRRPVAILHTRKTTPLLRALEIEAVTIGGGARHRASLADGMLLIKDNHIAIAGSVSRAVERARRAHAGKIECEVTSIDEARAAVDAGADMLLLDNMSLAEVRRAVRLFDGRVPLEVSGGVTLANAAKIARTGVDRISIGALTHSAPAANLSLELALGSATR